MQVVGIDSSYRSLVRLWNFGAYVVSMYFIILKRLSVMLSELLYTGALDPHCNNNSWMKNGRPEI
jgi:hypothetical protein